MLTAPSPAPARSQRLDFNHGENKPKRDPPPGSRLCRPRPAAALLLFPSLFRAQALAAPLLQTKGSWPPRTKAPPSPPCQPPRGSQRAAQGGRAQDTLGDGPKDASDPTRGVGGSGLGSTFVPPTPWVPPALPSFGVAVAS